MSRPQSKKLKSLLGRMIRLPAKVINTRIRLSMGLSAGVLTLVLLAQLFDIVPNPNRAKMGARKLQTETLALTGSALVNTRSSLDEFQHTLEHTLERDADLLSIGLRDTREELDIEIGDHAENWEMPQTGKSNDQFMFVPIFRNQQRIGQLEMRYRGLVSVSTWLRSQTAVLSGFMLVGSFLIFNLILYRTLKQLDPRGAVPKRVREALDNMAEGLVIVERTGRIMLANSKFASLVGSDSEALIGTNCSEFEWDCDEELPWERVVRTKTTVSDSTLQIIVDDVKLTFSVSAAPVLGRKGSCRGVMITFDDITTLEQNKLELIAARKAADDANDAKSNFLSRMSHEIRTPMNAIIGYTDLLRQGAESEVDQQMYLSTIHTSGDHLLTVINDILDLSKIEAGQMTTENRQFELLPLLSQVIRTLKINAREKGVLLELAVEGQVPSKIISDETRLRQILINIIGNAIKFTDQGGVLLNVRMPQQTTGSLLEIDVADTGIGMPESALENIFNPFSQADDSVTRKFGGTGLGLAISKQLSEALGGNINVRSQEGSGTVFTISIDPGALGEDVQWVSQENLLEITQRSQKSEPTTTRFKKAHILVVDDTKANRDLAGVMLKRMGLTFDHAENGQVALDRLAENHYDLVLMDMSMPVMDGLTATGKIREAGSSIPVVALTAMATDAERMQCLNGGCDAFLPKPIRMQGLVEAISEFLKTENGDHAESAPVATKEVVRATNPRVPPNTVSHSLAKSNAETEWAATEDDVDESLLATLTSLGFESKLAKNKPCSSQGSELVLPDAVHSSLPLDEDTLPIVAEFVSRLPGRLKEFAVAWQARDIGTLNDLGHWLAGSAATVGLDDFVAPARELENSDGSDVQRMELLIGHILKLASRIDLGAVTR